MLLLFTSSKQIKRFFFFYVLHTRTMDRSMPLGFVHDPKKDVVTAILVLIFRYLTPAHEGCRVYVIPYAVCMTMGGGGGGGVVLKFLGVLQPKPSYGLSPNFIICLKQEDLEWIRFWGVSCCHGNAFYVFRVLKFVVALQVKSIHNSSGNLKSYSCTICFNYTKVLVSDSIYWVLFCSYT